ncbi:class I SAM-dependent methyltransferase [Oceanobacillus kimchii]|uniref:SAM-dependent methyltransferase n=1 Tax=Oceanobacillus kimchii TaxID=746691 RepID=A0ABQ5TFS9_9BACI|nr:class I SAM-dependent methyltransferase [Oceanobacillus kimchii]GLO65071.1 SAM-dependent methyltransferase [Oceanobacillus kimchii]
MGKWFPSIYDLLMRPLEQTKLKKIRKTLVSQAVGRVLEVGSGTGVNFPHYLDATRVDAIEPNPLMKERALKRTERARIPIQTYLVKAEKLPFADNTFDTVVATLVFCTIPEPMKALQEIQRVSKPNAKILFFEHVRLDQASLGKTQDILTPLWKKICDGCHLNRDTLELIKQSNLSVLKVDSYFNGIFLSIKCLNE